MGRAQGWWEEVPVLINRNISVGYSLTSLPTMIVHDRRLG